ncbi:MAG: hypothetical protein OXC81_06190, partial [Betaproteobacteria bacterium]|nr:hypothetical protein [Betaproteobacteria bacterium]
RAVEVEQLRELRKQNREAAPKTTSFGQLLKDTLGEEEDGQPAGDGHAKVADPAPEKEDK